jgi:hypothetical protein
MFTSLLFSQDHDRELIFFIALGKSELGCIPISVISYISNPMNAIPDTTLEIGDLAVLGTTVVHLNKYALDFEK